MGGYQVTEGESVGSKIKGSEDKALGGPLCKLEDDKFVL